jgi:hypothetical protein
MSNTIKAVVVAVDLQKGAEDADVDAAAPLHGPMSLVRSVIKKVIMPKIVGPAWRMMMAAMVKKKSTLLMGLTLIGTRTRVPHTHHITGELNNLTMRDAYKGYDKVNTSNGQGMTISHIGQSVVHNHARNFHLHNVLYVPNISKNLLSVHRFTYDNCTYNFILSSF